MLRKSRSARSKKAAKLAIIGALARGHQCVGLRVMSRTTGSGQRFIPSRVGRAGKVPTHP